MLYQPLPRPLPFIVKFEYYTIFIQFVWWTFVLVVIGIPLLISALQLFLLQMQSEPPGMF